MNLLIQLAPGGPRMPDRSENQLDVPVEPSPFLQPEILLTVLFISIALLLWVGTTVMKRRSERK